MSADSHRHFNSSESLKAGHGVRNGGDMRYDFIRRGSETWTAGKISIQELCEKVQYPRLFDYWLLTNLKRQPVPNIQVIFLPEVADIMKSAAHEEFFQIFQIPPAFQGSVVHDASGYFGCRDTRDADGKQVSFSSQIRLLVKQPMESITYSSNAGDINSSYIWHRLGVFLSWTPFKNLTVLCFGLPVSLKHSLSNLTQLNLDDPFSFHAIFIESTLALYDTALWSWRDLVRDLEQNRTSSNDPRPDYIKMHEIARHIIHCSETLATAIEGMTSLIQEHEIFFQENPSLPVRSVTRSRQTRRTFRSQITLFKCLYLRSKALEKRLRNETNLAFNTVAQYDSHIAVRIGEATQVDSAAMKTISVLGLVFLPATFICALFSMSFFEYEPGTNTEPQRWSVSEKFWVYWVVAIPVTLVTVACWVMWQKTYSRRS